MNAPKLEPVNWMDREAIPTKDLVNNIFSQSRQSVILNQLVTSGAMAEMGETEWAQRAVLALDQHLRALEAILRRHLAGHPVFYLTCHDCPNRGAK